MLAPCWWMKAGYPCELRLPLDAVGTRIRVDSCEPTRTVERINVVGRIGGNFVKDRQVAGEHWYAESERFDEGHPVTFDERRKQQCARVLKPGEKPLIAAVGFFDYRTTQRCTSVEHIDGVFTFPAASADNDEFWCCATELLDQTSPDVKNKPVVFARFDCSQHHEVGIAQRGGCLRGRFDAWCKFRDNRRRGRQTGIGRLCMQR